MTGRRRLLDIDTTKTKTISLNELQPDHKILAIFVIILLKSINNLLIELGLEGIVMFLKDLSDDLILQKGTKELK